ncbi:CDP-glycerol glycerophosphotransferase family protein [Nocardioides sp. R1-1]|uniref:CDP-glycerol glycerophosphotransferase family protein n=1 Tax=Nocardioides sp. R1-1 TaxID=3383502 RepID=UPI0038D15D9E
MSNRGARIVYNSFHGRYSDSPRAIFERLRDPTDPGAEPGAELEHVWLAHRDHLHAFPAGVTTVDIEGPEAGALLEGADILVANTHTEVEWTKSDATFYLQTWHGTPLKRIHHDVLWAPEGRLARLDEDVARWDLLLSPNAFSTPLLRRAFRFGGPIEETGYPRNDVLASYDGGGSRERMVRSLGLRSDRRVVLYAPTWRDDECFDEACGITTALDLAAWVEELGADHELLVRSHSMVTGRSTHPDLPGVHDVSWYPDIRDLYLAADVLVTDYSSAMFDFSITRRPMVFFAYDLERFATAIRGFYFDFLPEAPGPVVRTSAELVALMSDLDGVAGTYATAADAFRRRFCSLEDGGATDRAIALLPLPGREPPRPTDVARARRTLDA